MILTLYFYKPASRAFRNSSTVPTFWELSVLQMWTFGLRVTDSGRLWDTWKENWQVGQTEYFFECSPPESWKVEWLGASENLRFIVSNNYEVWFCQRKWTKHNFIQQSADFIGYFKHLNIFILPWLHAMRDRWEKYHPPCNVTEAGLKEHVNRRSVKIHLVHFKSNWIVVRLTNIYSPSLKCVFS